VPLTDAVYNTAHGALLNHITGGHVDAIEAGPRSFQPMNVNFGLFPPLAEAVRRVGTARTLAKKQALSARALGDLELWIGDHPAAAAE